MENSERFKEWLTGELKKRNWSYEELARQAGKNASRPLISLTLAGERSITWNFCLAIAGPLGYRPEEVFKIAGLLPNGSNGNEERES